MSHRIRCHCCRGTGTVPLPKPLRLTLAAMPRAGGITAEMLLLRMRFEGIGVTGMSNRLRDLLKLRLVRRVRRGKWWDYSRA